MKAALMAAHLSREDVTLLTQCFGFGYASKVTDAMSLEWLHSERVSRNLEWGFGVKLR